MTKPCLAIRIEHNSSDETDLLRQENQMLKKMLSKKKVNAIEAKCELLE